MNVVHPDPLIIINLSRPVFNNASKRADSLSSIIISRSGLYKDLQSSCKQCNSIYVLTGNMGKNMKDET